MIASSDTIKPYLLTKNMKVFIGFQEIANYYNNLSQGFKEVGIDCIFLQENKHPFLYKEESKNKSILQILEHYLMTLNEQKKITNNLFNKLLLKILPHLIKLLIFLLAIFKYDVFIFGYKSSFIKNFYDLPILRILNKKIFFVFHGSDLRPPYIDGALFNEEVNSDSISKCIKNTNQQKKSIKIIEKYADFIISHPPTAHLQERSFVKFLTIGLPYKINTDNVINTKIESEENNEENNIIILHAPSNPEVKGTLLIQQAIYNLKSKGYYIKYIEIKNKPNSFVIETLKSCDFIVDQVYSDTPLAGLATEAAFFGKPAVVGGYFTHEDMFTECIPPSHLCNPYDIEQAIEKMILDKEYRIELGKNAKTYVETYWNHKQVAANYLRLIQGNIPEDWLCNPQNISYLYGCGLSKTKIKKILKSIFEIGGIEALQLQDKPNLSKMFYEFANRDDC